MANMPNARTILPPNRPPVMPSVPPSALPSPLPVSFFSSPDSILETAQLNTALPIRSPRYHGLAYAKNTRDMAARNPLAHVWRFIRHSPKYPASTAGRNNNKNKYELNCMYLFVSFISGFYLRFPVISSSSAESCKAPPPWRRCRRCGYHPPRRT